MASFILIGLPQLDTMWRPLFQEIGMRLCLTGVFCHQTPKARYDWAGKTQQPELADLLIVRRHRYRGGAVRQLAALVQAKMSGTGEIILKTGDPQLHLYTVWPTFNVLGRNAPATDFCLGHTDWQGIYAGIRTSSPSPYDNDAWVGFCPWAVMQPKQRGWVDMHMSRFLTRLVDLTAGREFYDHGTTGCRWSELVHYLVTTTFSLPLRTRDMRTVAPRGITIGLNRMAFMASDGDLASAYVPQQRVQEIVKGSDSPTNPDDPLFDDGGEGRVIIIETDEGGE